MKSYKSKKILVVGLGRSGSAAAGFLAGEGARVTVTDARPRSEFSSELEALTEFDIHYVLGSNPPSIFTDQDLIVASPGVPLDIEGIKLAKDRGIPVVCELELGLSHLSGKLIGVTGTNGKSTTTTLIGEMLAKVGEDIWVGGNIGRPLTDGLDQAGDARFVVLELSSYQLETAPSLKPYLAVWLNAAPDHLDRYHSFDQYVDAKAAIGQNQTPDDWVVFNADDNLVTSKVEFFRSKKVPFSISRNLDYGAWYDGVGRLNLKGGGFEFSVDTGISKLRGIHNKENIAAASLTAAICGVGRGEIEEALAGFRGLPHRLQFVRELNGVSYFNDSKGTNTHAVCRSVQSFDAPVVLIAGGQDKNTGYQDLVGVAREKIRMIIAIGEASERIKDELGSVTNVIICSSMDEAVKLASAKSQSGDIVLLSPACASFDMYRDYAERGDEFVRCVKRL